MARDFPAIVPGFLHERLAAAAAVPAAERTPEIAGLLECCRLKDEAAALLDQPLPRGATAAAEERVRRPLQAALRLIRADMLCAAAPLDEYNDTRRWIFELFKGTVRAHSQQLGGTLSLADSNAQFMAFGRRTIQSAQPSPAARLHNLLLTVAALPPPPVTEQLEMLLLLLGVLAQPAAHAALEPLLLQAQSSLPAPLLTWNQLAGRVVGHAAHCCVIVYSQIQLAGRNPNHNQIYLRTARQCEEMLPALIAAPDQPSVAVGALHAAAALLILPRQGGQAFLRTASAGFEHARAVGSDYFTALLGFDLGAMAAREMHYGAAPPYSPSQFVGWVSQAQAAFSRCKRLLPGLWLTNVTDLRTPALAALPWLQQLAAAGDRWAQPPPETRAAVDRSQEEQAKLFLDPNYNIGCAACGRSALTLKFCSKCRAVSYCSRECQVKDWKEGGHREKCAALAAARKQQKGSAAA